MATVQNAGRQYRGVSESERHQERRARLLEAGIAIFGDHGYHNSTVKSVCAAAGLTERYFYQSFTNREDFFRVVYEHEVQKLRGAILHAVLAQTGPEQMAKTGLTTFFATLQNDLRLSRILLLEATRVGGEMDTVWRKSTDEFAVDLTRLAPVFLGKTNPSKYDVELVAAGMVGIALNISLTWYHSGFAKPLRVVVDNCFLQFEALRLFLAKK